MTCKLVNEYSSHIWFVPDFKYNTNLQSIYYYPEGPEKGKYGKTILSWARNSVWIVKELNSEDEQIFKKIKLELL